jgi:DNA (cytosine-5)-methyltransferase 1
MAPADALRKRLEIDTEFYRQAISREVRELWEYPDGYTGSNLPSVQDWKQFDEAIRRWELTIACDAPPATQLSPRGSWTLSPFLTEWMMGIPGRISSTPGLTRNEQIKLAGNGVVPQQAILAITELYDRLAESFASERAA